MIDLKSWQLLWERLGAEQENDALFQKLVDAYSEKHRVYHDKSHLIQCFSEFVQVKDLLISPDTVEAAIWFHDAVYNPASNKNEEESARWAEKELTAAGVPDDAVKKIFNLILATRHDTIPQDADTKFFLDIDLSIFGSNPYKYEEYQKSIRKEYKWVPSFLYKKNRAGLLKSFLDRESIYHTIWFQEKFEERARENIEAELAEL